MRKDEIEFSMEEGSTMRVSLPSMSDVEKRIEELSLQCVRQEGRQRDALEIITDELQNRIMFLAFCILLLTVAVAVTNWHHFVSLWNLIF